MDKLKDPKVIGAAIGMIAMIAAALFAPIGDGMRAICASFPPAISQGADAGQGGAR